MFLLALVFLCAVYVPSATSHGCFPETKAATKHWRYDSGENDVIGKFNPDLEEHLNRQINYELSASYSYLSMSYHFQQDDYFMPGFAKFFKKMSEEENEHAQMFMKYQNKRGGRIRLNSVPKPCDDGSWGNGTIAMKKALELEKYINKMLLKLHKVGEDNDEHQFLDFLEGNFLGEQVDSIKEIANYVNILTRIGGSSGALGEYQFDKLTLGGGKE